MTKTIMFLIFCLVVFTGKTQSNQRTVDQLNKFSSNGPVTSNKGSVHRLAVLRLKRAKEFYVLGRLGHAIKEYNAALQLAKEHNFPLVKSESFEGIGLCLSAFHNIPESISALTSGLLINNERGNAKGNIGITRALSDAYFEKRDFDSALHFATLSLQSSLRLNMLYEVQAARLSSIAALIRLRRWEEADREFTSFMQNSRHDSLRLMVRYHALLGNYFLAKDELEKSQSHYDTALNWAHSLSSAGLLGTVYGNMIDSYVDKGNLKKGLQCLELYNQEIKKIYVKDNLAQHDETYFPFDLYKNNVIALNFERKLMDLQLLQETKESSVKSLQIKQQAEENRLGKERLRQDVEENRLKEERLRQGEAVRTWLEHRNVEKDSLLVLKDSLLHKEALLSAARKKEIEKAKELQLARKRENENKIRTLVVGLIGALLFGTVIFYQYKRKAKKNLIIEKQKDEMQTLMKEIHHRVKNNLQVISSLLDLQSQTLSDDQASLALEEGKNRVLSMALIHQNLYGEKGIKGINVKDYIQNLSNSLIDSYNVKPGVISITATIDDLSLDVDTVVPLGLILNELISNSIKHAFKHQQKGEIQIRLQENGNVLELNVSDNGSGFADCSNQKQKSFGMKLIKSFAIKLKAKLEIYNDHGACIRLQIHKYSLA